MNSIISIKDRTINGVTVQTVNARDLHVYLESGWKFSDWIKERIGAYGFIDGRDYVCQEIRTQYNQVDRIDFHISIDMAKELAMVERNEKGKQARQYFIECERKLKLSYALPDFTDPAEAAIAWANEYRGKAAALKQIEEQKPKIQAFDTFMGGKNSLTMNEVAKALDIGRNKLFSYLRESQVLMRNNMPFQRYIASGYFTVRVVPINHGDFVENVTQPLVTAKGMEFIRRTALPVKGS